MPLLNPPPAALGRENAIVAGRGRQYTHTFAGPLSVKTVIKGEAVWETAAGRFAIAPGAALLVNDGEEYTVEIDALQPVETFCFFFERGFVEDAYRVCTSSDAALLDEPHRAAAIEFPERLLFDLPPLANDEASFYAVAAQLAQRRHESDVRARSLPALRAATRDELRRRLERGVAFLHGSAADAITIADAARAACLSRFHFHRLFVQFTGETPHRYLTRLRIARAQSLLRGTSRSVAEVAAECGFESAASFATLFGREVGASPSAFRLATFTKRPAGADATLRP